MTGTSKTFYPPGGLNYFIEPSLSYVVPIRICVDGVGFKIKTSGSPGSREVVYTASEGRFDFEMNFVGSGPFGTTDITNALFIKWKIV